MTPSERRTLVVVAGGLLAASLLRVGWETRHPPPEIPSDTTGIGELVDATEEAVAEEERRRTPLAEGETVDPNRDPEVELARLEGVGPALAAAIAEAREEAPFRRPEDLERVPGIGEATVRGFAGDLDLADPPPDPAGRGARSRISVGGSAREGRLDLNRASAEEMEELPGIGPVTAARIVQLRRGRHSLEELDELLEVSGIGPATLERIEPEVAVRP